MTDPRGISAWSDRRRGIQAARGAPGPSSILSGRSPSTPARLPPWHRGAFRGAGDTWTPLGAAFVGNWILRVPLAMAAALWLDLPLVYLWMVLILDHVAWAAWLTLGYRRGTWKRRLAARTG